MNCFIYTYGSHERGMGHIYQSCGLARAMEEEVGAEVRFLVPDHPEGLNKLREWNLDIVEVPRHLADKKKISHIGDLLSASGVDVVIMDVLESSPVLMEYFRKQATCLVSLDDIGPGRDFADLLINVIHHPPRNAQASYVEINDLNYVILRESFHLAHKRAKEIPNRAHRILVSQGGSDTFGGIIELAKALATLPCDVEVILLVGSAFRHEAELERAVQPTGRSFTVLRDVEDMAGLMQCCDLAITGVGKTVFELAAVGVPFVMVTEEPRELETANIVAQHVLCENLELRAEVGAENIALTIEKLVDDRDQREAMSRSGKATVDGRGAWRTARVIAEKWQEKEEERSEAEL